MLSLSADRTAGAIQDNAPHVFFRCCSHLIFVRFGRSSWFCAWRHSTFFDGIERKSKRGSNKPLTGMERFVSLVDGDDFDVFFQVSEFHRFGPGGQALVDCSHKRFCRRFYKDTCKTVQKRRKTEAVFKLHISTKKKQIPVS